MYIYIYYGNTKERGERQREGGPQVLTWYPF